MLHKVNLITHVFQNSTHVPFYETGHSNTLIPPGKMPLIPFEYKE